MRWSWAGHVDNNRDDRLTEGTEDGPRTNNVQKIAGPMWMRVAQEQEANGNYGRRVSFNCVLNVARRTGFRILQSVR